MTITEFKEGHAGRRILYHVGKSKFEGEIIRLWSPEEVHVRTYKKNGKQIHPYKGTVHFTEVSRIFVR